MPKTVENYLLEGGINRKSFIDPNYSLGIPGLYSQPKKTIYTVKRISPRNRLEKSPILVLEGETREGKLYSKDLVLCLDHKEYVLHWTHQDF